MPELLLTPEERARHDALSPVQTEWLDFVAARPEALDPSTFTEFDAAVELEPVKVQPWPLFVDSRGFESIASAGRETFRLIKTVPERIFGADPERMAEFYGCDARVVERSTALLADPKCLAHLIGRGDFILGPQGFACCEFNISGNLGGWQAGLWKDRFLSHRLVAEFLAAQHLRVLPLNALDALLEHAIEVGLDLALAAVGELNLAIVTSSKMMFPELHELAGQRYREILADRAPGLTGSVLICGERELTWREGRAWHAGRPVQLFIDQAMELLDGPVFRAQTAGSGFAFNGLVSPILTDKRNLALLSEQADDGDLYDAEERAAIRRFIPWTRILADGFTDRHGERIYLPDFARAERERLVIKPATGFGGKGVSLGASLEAAEWEARLDAALADGDCVIQELVPSETYLFQAPEGGAVPHELVWGAFVFGERFGSCLLRGAPSGTGVINVSRGARRIVLLEVTGEAAVSSIDPFRSEEIQYVP